MNIINSPLYRGILHIYFIAWLQAVPLMLHALYLSHITALYAICMHNAKERVYIGQVLPVSMRSLGARL